MPMSAALHKRASETSSGRMPLVSGLPGRPLPPWVRPAQTVIVSLPRTIPVAYGRGPKRDPQLPRIAILGMVPRPQASPRSALRGPQPRGAGPGHRAVPRGPSKHLKGRRP
jgi:hypothetical protein